MIDWAAFVVVFAASLISACVVVALYALGTRLLAVAGRALFVEPVEFTDAITVSRRRGPQAAAQGREGAAEEPAERRPETAGARRRLRLLHPVRRSRCSTGCT